MEGLAAPQHQHRSVLNNIAGAMRTLLFADIHTYTNNICCVILTAVNIGHPVLRLGLPDPRLI